MKYTVDEIVETKENDWKGMTRTYFRAGAMEGYLLTMPRNVPRVGDELDGEFAEDKGGEMKFTKTKTFGMPNSAPGIYDGRGQTARPNAPITDDRQRSIIRQHSQHMALLYAALSKEAPTLDEVREVTNWFETDASGKAKSKDEIDLDDLGF